MLFPACCSPTRPLPSREERTLSDATNALGTVKHAASHCFKHGTSTHCSYVVGCADEVLPRDEPVCKQGEGEDVHAGTRVPPCRASGHSRAQRGPAGELRGSEVERGVEGKGDMVQVVVLCRKNEKRRDTDSLKDIGGGGEAEGKGEIGAFQTLTQCAGPALRGCRSE